jgi:hypothetical protein
MVLAGIWLRSSVMAVSVHANVADAQAVVTRKLTLYGEIPLIGLRIAVIGIDTLIEAPSAVLHAHRGRRGVGELDQWRAIRGHAVGISVQLRRSGCRCC